MKPRLNFARRRNWVLSLLSALFLGATGAHAGEAVRADRSGTRACSVALCESGESAVCSFTIYLCSGVRHGDLRGQRWDTSAIARHRALCADYLGRLEQILNKADALGMAVILGYFYFGQ